MTEPLNPNSITWEFLLKYGGQFRVHGNGFIQCNIQVDGPEQRIHIFGHPAVGRQIEPTPVHDHRFGFESTVLFGTLVNARYAFLTDAKDEDHTHYACTFEAPPPGSNDTKLDKHTDQTGALWLDYDTFDSTPVELMQTGDTYEMLPGHFHETFSNEPTITLMRKTMTRDIQPRVLCRIGQEPDNGWHREKVMHPAEVMEIVRDTFDRAGRLS